MHESMKVAALQCLAQELEWATHAGGICYGPQQKIIAHLLLVCSRFIRMKVFTEHDILWLLTLIDTNRFVDHFEKICSVSTIPSQRRAMVIGTLVLSSKDVLGIIYLQVT